MKIIDCFIFYNEMDLLTYRLNILNDVVDFFVIVEATRTFIGKEKPLFYNENKHLFEKFHDKIIHIIVDDFPYKYPSINIARGDQWENERFQRNQIKKGIEKLMSSNAELSSTDILTITDLDEIPDPLTLLKIKNQEIKVEIHVLEMDLYHYNLNTIGKDKWLSARILTFKKYIELSLSCDNFRFYKCPIIKDGGWHLSYFGDSNFIKNKIENFSHQEYNNIQYNTVESLTNKINNFKNIFADNGSLRKILINENKNLPYKYDIFLQKYVVC
jgi:beta-1,4-mannosyl-glycoprotein beta-1,4-N-acetylglucosaminyltransferase